jgi:hypothetical protein
MGAEDNCEKTQPHRVSQGGAVGASIDLGAVVSIDTEGEVSMDRVLGETYSGREL